MKTQNRYGMMGTSMGWIAFAATLVFLFRLAAWLQPAKPQLLPDAVLVPAGIVGLIYLIAGLFVWSSEGTPLSRVFLVYAFAHAVSWGGAAQLAGGSVEVVVVSLVASAGAIAATAFVDLALRYPDLMRGTDRLRRILYFPCVMLVAGAFTTPLWIQGSDVAVLRMVNIFSFVVASIGGLIFVARWIRVSSNQRRAQYLTWIVSVLLTTRAAELLARWDVIPGTFYAWRLLYLLEPIVLAAALYALERRPHFAPLPPTRRGAPGAPVGSTGQSVNSETT